ncbi:MAG: hypothetical protein KGI66_00680 [Patescibacteria group bacterium]|nr:hypothetical protein [Patescibacteria group bacterium]
MAQWFSGIPPIEEINKHESYHPRPDGLRLGRVTVDDGDGSNSRYVKADDRSYGDWICNHHQSKLQTYLSFVRLKTIEGSVYFELGFTSWVPLEATSWAKDCLFFPVASNGLPVENK